MLILKGLTQRFHLTPKGKNISPSHSIVDLETAMGRSQPINAETLSELLELTSRSENEERLCAEGLEDILRYIGNG